MAIQKKSLIGKRQSGKKALVAKRVSADAPKAAQVKAPGLMAPTHHTAPFRMGHTHNAPFRLNPSQHSSPFVAMNAKFKMRQA